MRVNLQSGMLQEASPGEPQEIGNSIERRAMLVYCGKFQAMDGEVEVDEEKLNRLVSNHNSYLSKLTRLATGEVPMKGCPPVQLDHSTSAKDTVGRVVGDLELGDHTTEDGKAVKAIFSKIKILGKDNVEKVMDGRWQHLSVGADFEEGKLSELSITPFPAAAEASMLKKGDQLFSKQAFMGHKIEAKEVGEGQWKVTVDGEEIPAVCETEGDAMAEGRDFVRKNVDKLSEGEGMDKEKLKKRLMDKEKISEAEADEKLSKMSDDDMKKMSKEVEDEEKLAAEAVEDEEKKKVEEKLSARKVKLAAARTTLTQLSTDFRANHTGAQLALKKSQILSRLASLRANAKITPAEVKKIELDRLAASNEATIDAVLKSYEDREPVIMTGALGSIKAEELSKLGAKQRISTLEAETRANMPLLSRMSKAKKLSEGEGVSERVERKLAEEPKQENDYLSDYEAICKMMDEGKHAEVKEKLKSWMSKRMSGENTEGVNSSQEQHSQMSALAESVKKLQTQFEGLEKLTQDLVAEEA